MTGLCDGFEADVLLMAASGYIGLKVECKVRRTERGRYLLTSCSPEIADEHGPTAPVRGHNLVADCSFSAEGARTAWIQRKSSETCSLGEIPVSAGGNRPEGCRVNDLTLVAGARTRGKGRSGR